MRRAAALIVAVGALALPAAAVAQDCPRTTLADVEDEVMCPICGTPLGLASEAPQAERERAYIEDLIADCRSKEEIKTALVAQFGEQVLALPGDESGQSDVGDVLVYLIPALALLAGAAGIALATIRWRGRADGPRRGADEQAPAAGAARLDADLERYDL